MTETPGPGGSTPGGNGGDNQGKVTNRDTDITNTEDQDNIGEGAGENNPGRDEPEIDHPATKPASTEEKIPDMSTNRNKTT